VDGLSPTATGTVRGVQEEGVWVFRGIPYARDPSGSARWRRPEPPAAWPGVYEADHFGRVAPQPPPVPGMSIPGDPKESSEDCLSLNVWTPGIDDERRPVMAWIHGGGFTSGSGSSLLYRGDRLARMGDVVVVTINYRLGALGFLAHPSLADDAGGFGNWGLLDQLAALSWVKVNIANFGGDPQNVTVFGESAGAMSISALLSADAATGLFQRAVIQSGPPTSGSPAWAQRRVSSLASKLWPEGGHTVRIGAREEFDRSVFERVTPEDLVSATRQLEPENNGLPLPFLPVIDGGLLRELPAEVVRSGSGQRVPLLIGTNRDECTFFALGDPRAAGMTEARLVRRVRAIVGEELTGELLHAYRYARSTRSETTDPLSLWTAVTTDLVFRMPSLALADAHGAAGAEVFTYLFTWESPFLGGILGSAHALEVPFVFGTVAERAVQPYSGGGPAALGLADSMMRSWVAFATNGDPSCDELGEWPGYDVAKRETMVLGEHSGVEVDPRGEERDAWSASGVDMANRLYQP
jgi:para-nitrobenzyl esterase